MEYNNRSYESISRLNQYNSFPQIFSGYKAIFYNSFFVGICSKNTPRKTTSTASSNVARIIDSYRIDCSKQLLRSGLETISIFILESSREQLNQYKNFNTTKAKSILNSNDLKTLGKLFFPFQPILPHFLSLWLTLPDFNFLVEMVSVESEKAFKKIFFESLEANESLSTTKVFETWAKSIVTFGAFLGISCFFWLHYFDQISKGIWLTRGMIGMIPLKIILENEEVRRRFESELIDKRAWV